MKNLLLFAYHFPPLETIGAQRFGKMCRHMAQYGWRPIVICPDGDGSLEHGLPDQDVIRVGVCDEGVKRHGGKKTTRGMSPLMAPLYKLGRLVRFNLRAYDHPVVREFAEQRVRFLQKLLGDWRPSRALARRGGVSGSA